MEKNLKHALIGLVVVVGGYQVYKHFSKPKTAPKAPETKSSASGKKYTAGMLNYDIGTNKVSKLIVKGFDSQWIMLAEKDQPKPMSWYNYNGKWVWVKWNGKFGQS